MRFALFLVTSHTIRVHSFKFKAFEGTRQKLFFYFFKIPLISYLYVPNVPTLARLYSIDYQIVMYLIDLKSIS